MNKENYFGMYLGQRVDDSDSGYTLIGTLKNVDISGKYITCYIENDEIDEQDSFLIENCKLILRPLSDMTDDEISSFREIPDTDRYGDTENELVRKNYLFTSMFLSVDEFEYLISIGIDIFDLKSKGWAVYESDLKGDKK